ncbi:PAS domain [Nostoc flagelliforme CCNUN1]|uniref:PAS domain n=1 Tax=Nostoc flagelliforme CCNUN1 TaxID=2038116 RepID=A0A2K8SZB3_9NOSO|nr:PAS domain [Nostoc flagelliforme CCNUN1]
MNFFCNPKSNISNWHSHYLIRKNKGQMTNLILVVDDDLMRSQLCEQLIEAGYQAIRFS